MKKSNSSEEQVCKIAWTEPINSIKRHGAWHSGLVTIKIFGDGILLFTAGKIIYEWLGELFLFLRQVCLKPKEELIRQSSTIANRVMDFQKNMMKMNESGAAMKNIASKTVTMGGGTIISECADFRLSPTNLLKYLWKILTNSYGNVVQWLILLKAQFNFEITKYAIQICGCISYYLELLDKVWYFGLN